MKKTVTIIIGIIAALDIIAIAKNNYVLSGAKSKKVTSFYPKQQEELQ